MAAKVQVNPSSLKVLFNPVTQKVQMAVVGSVGPTPGVPCSYCAIPSQTPAQIVVGFTGIQVCSGCYPYGGAYWKWQFLEDVNGEYIVDQNEYDSCVWRNHIYSPTFLRKLAFSDSLCTVPTIQGDYDVLQIIVHKMATKMYIVMQATYGQYGDIVGLFSSGEIDFETGCVGVSGVVNLFGVDDCGASDVDQAGYGGTADVVEI
jgi:hypothetical protein